MKKIKYYIKRKFWQIRNVFRWLPVIWNQFDFDKSYAIQVFTFQLSKIADFLESDRAMTVSAKRNAQQIRTVLSLFKKIEDSEYGSEYQDQIKEIYGPSVINFYFEDTGEGNGSSFLKHEFEKWDNAEEVQKKYDELFLKSRAKEEKANKLVWKLIENQINGWWD